MAKFIVIHSFRCCGTWNQWSEGLGALINLEAIVDSTHHEDMLNITYAAITPNSKLILREASFFSGCIHIKNVS
jgi:hypothetical protein